MPLGLEEFPQFVGKLGFFSTFCFLAYKETSQPPLYITTDLISRHEGKSKVSDMNYQISHMYYLVSCQLYHEFPDT